MKKINIIIAVGIVIILGILLFHIFDKDKSLSLPLTQKIKIIAQIIRSPVNKTTLDHIVIITMENKSYDEIVGSPNARYINSLIHTYSFSDNYFAVSHPSLPNYIALIGGNTFGITSDCTDCFVNATNLVDQLEVAQKTWKAYMESVPSACFTGSEYPYEQKHNPFIYFDDIRNNPVRCQRIVPFSQLTSDFQATESTPNFVWISPNLCSDMHDCPVQTGDLWLANQVPKILSSPAFTKQKSVLVITWDEGEDSGSNRVPIVFIGNGVRHGFVSHTAYTHYSLLHSIENMWNLPPLTKEVSQSAVMMDLLSQGN